MTKIVALTVLNREFDSWILECSNLKKLGTYRYILTAVKLGKDMKGMKNGKRLGMDDILTEQIKQI